MFPVAWPFCLGDQITPVSFKVTNLPGKLQKGSVHVNQMKPNFPSNHKMQVQNAKNADISNNTFQAFTNDNDIYLVEHVKKPRHQNGKLKFLIRWLGYSNHQNTWEWDDHLPSALVREYFQQSSLKKPMPIKSSRRKFRWKDHQSLGVVILHPLLYCYASSFCGSCLRRHNPTQYQFSTWDLLMIITSYSTWWYLDSSHWRIVLTVCHNRKPPLRYSVENFSDILSLLPPSYLLLYVTKLLQWRATMITSSHEKLVIAPHNHSSCQVAHIYNQV